MFVQHAYESLTHSSNRIPAVALRYNAELFLTLSGISLTMSVTQGESSGPASEGLFP